MEASASSLSRVKTQYVVLHGLVRPDDVSSANTVNRAIIAEARVEFMTRGALTDAQKRGWLMKLYENLRPVLIFI